MTATVEPVITVKSVNHHLGLGPLRRQILFDITTEISVGEVVVVMGPSGSGKTTLLNLIGALRTVVDGSVKVLGKELHGASDSGIIRMRQRLGFVFQQHHLLESLTACQNMQMGLGALKLPQKESRQRAVKMLANVGLENFVNSFPNQLSGGQCQRVAVARALVRNPEVVLADEPTASLDKQSGRDIGCALSRANRAAQC